MISKILQKLKLYLLYGVAFSFVLTISSFVSDLFTSKNLSTAPLASHLFSSKSSPTVSKGLQLPSIIPYASADDPHNDGSDGGDSCDSGDASDCDD